MDLWDIIKTVLRRWYVVVPTLVVAGVFATLTASNRTPTYEVTGAIILVAPGLDQTPEALTGPRNPYLAFTGSLETTANAVVAVLQNQRVREGLTALGANNEYEITVDRDAPIITITARADAPEVVSEVVDRLVEVADRSLVDLQDSVDAPSESRIRASVLVEPTPPRREQGNLKRELVTVAGLGVTAAVSLALVVDALVAQSGKGAAGKRTRRRSSGRAARSRDQQAQAIVPPEPSDSAHGPSANDWNGQATTTGRQVRSDSESSARALLRRWAGDGDDELIAAPLASSPSRRPPNPFPPTNGRDSKPDLEPDLREIRHLLDDGERPAPAQAPSTSGKRSRKKGHASSRR